MSEKRVTLSPERLEALKAKHGLTEEAVEEVLSSLQMVKGDEEEDIAGMFSKVGKGELGISETILMMDFMDRREDRQWRREQSKNIQNPSQDATSKEITELRKTVENLTSLFQSKEQANAQKVFAQEVVQQTTGAILPTLQQLQQRVETLETETTATPPPTAMSEVQNMTTELKKSIEDLGEKIGTKASAQKITVDDLTPIFDIIDRFEARSKKTAESGELDWRVTGVNVVGEVGKELVGAFRDIEKIKAGQALPSGTSPASQQTPTQLFAKRQLQNYIMQRLQAGATQLNMGEASQKLGLTQDQIYQAYKTLEAEGWFRTIPQKPLTEGGKPNIEAQEQEEVFASRQDSTF